MNDCRQIENLIYRYAECIDNGDLPGVAALFTEGEIVSPAHDSRHLGYDEVLQLYRSSCRLHEPGGTPLTRHITTNVIIEIDADGQGASARASYLVVQATATLALQPIICGRYADRFRRVGDGWQFARRELYVDLVGNLSEHLLYTLR